MQVLQGLIIFTVLFFAVSPSAQVKREGLIRGLILNATQETAVDEKLLSELDRAYKIRDYEKVIQIYQKLPPRAKLPAEELYKIAESFFQTGHLERARDLAERVIGLRRGTSLACRAQFLKAKALFVDGKEREAQKIIQGLKGTFCEDELKEELSALGYLLFGRKDLAVEGKVLKRTFEELGRARFSLHLKQGKLKEAEKAVFDYLNLSGDYLSGRYFFFKLAEAYFNRGDLLSAKRYYQLIITEWDHTKEAFLSKFRLYQIAYERATVKDLLPQKTIEDLLMYITQIKNKYPEEPIAESALFLSIRIFFDRKDWERTRERAKEFLSLYPESQSKTQALSYYCNATSSLVPLWFLRGDTGRLLEISEQEKELLEESKCGVFYYSVGSEFYKYKLWEMSAYFLLKAYGLPLPDNYQPDYFLKLASLADERGDYATFEELIKIIEKKWGKALGNYPEFLYLQFRRAIKVDPDRANRILSELWKTPLSTALKEDSAQILFLRYIEDKKYNLAHSVLRTYLFASGTENYLILLYETFQRDPKLFETILEEAKRRFPEDPRIIWLEAYHSERKGDLSKVRELWKKLEEKEGKDFERELAQQYEVMKKLVDRARNLIF